MLGATLREEGLATVPIEDSEDALARINAVLGRLLQLSAKFPRPGASLIMEHPETGEELAFRLATMFPNTEACILAWSDLA